MRRLTFDLLLASTLAFAPMAIAQPMPGTPGSDTAPPTTRGTGTPSTPSPIDDTTMRRRSPTNPDPTAPPVNPSPTIPSPSPTTAPPAVPPDTSPRRRAPSPTDPTPGTTSDKTPSDKTPGANKADAGRTTTADTSSDPDLSVVGKVHQANQKEIEMGKLALEKAQSPKVKAYARKLVADHTAADKQILAWAKKKKIDPSQLEVAVDTSTTTKTDKAAKADAAKSDDAHARLMTSSGAEFDRDFATMMVDEHDKAIEMVRTATDSCSDKQLAKLLTGILPKLERHKKMAQELLDKHLKS